MNVTKSQMAKNITKKLQINPDLAARLIQSLIDQLTEELSDGNRIELRNFGVFEVVLRKSKIGRNPQNPKVDIRIPARHVVKFKPGKRIKIIQ